MKIVGHRGAKGYAPENTLLSFKKALELKCDRVEFDVRLTKDGHVVVIHDATLDRTTNGTGLVENMTLAEIRRFECPDGQKVPTLDEVIELCKGKTDLQIELKAKGTPQKVDEIIRRNALESHVLITSFESSLLKEMKDINPKLETCLLFKNMTDNIWDLVKRIEVNYIGPESTIVTEELITTAHRRGLEVYAYRVNEKEKWLRMAALGVDDIGTDFPDLMIY